MQVLKGLNADEQILAGTAGGLREGTLVEIQSAKSDAAPSTEATAPKAEGL